MCLAPGLLLQQLQVRLVLSSGVTASLNIRCRDKL
jgi:hypothetical protein